VQRIQGLPEGVLEECGSRVSGEKKQSNVLKEEGQPASSMAQQNHYGLKPIRKGLGGERGFGNSLWGHLTSFFPVVIKMLLYRERSNFWSQEGVRDPEQGGAARTKIVSKEKLVMGGGAITGIESLKLFSYLEGENCVF